MQAKNPLSNIGCTRISFEIPNQGKSFVHVTVFLLELMLQVNLVSFLQGHISWNIYQRFLPIHIVQ